MVSDILPNYHYCGLQLISETPIPELPESSKADNESIFFRVQNRQPISSVHWLHHWISATGQRMISYGHTNAHWLRFHELADFHISSDLTVITCYPTSVIPQETLIHLLLDQVLPRCLAHRGRVMLHASAVNVKQGILLFIGDSGAGKSTMAGNFHEAGHSALSDDCVWIKETQDQIIAVPTYGGLRLWQDSLKALFAEQDTYPMAHYSSKKRVPLDKNDVLRLEDGLPVLAVIFLLPPDSTSPKEIMLERLSNRETFIAILKQTFQLNLLDMERMRRHAQELGHLIPRLRAFRLSMPRDFSLLPTVRQKILEAALV
jgi:hypothetical protein